MQIDRKYKPELCVTKDPNRMPLKLLCVDTSREQTVVAATDGRQLVVVPVEVSVDERKLAVDGKYLLQTRAIAYARRQSQKHPNLVLGLGEKEVVVPVDDEQLHLKRDTASVFPNWRQVVPKCGGFKVSFDAQILLKLQQAMGAEAVTLEFATQSPGVFPEREAVLVKPCNQGWNKAFGVMMSMRGE